MVLFFLFGMLAVLTIAFMAVCVGMVLLGIFATVHRYLYLPIARARQPWLFISDKESDLPRATALPGPVDVYRYRRILEAIAIKQGRLHELRLKLLTVGLTPEEKDEVGDFFCDLWFLHGDRYAYETDPEFIKLLTMPGQRASA